MLRVRIDGAVQMGKTLQAIKAGVRPKIGQALLEEMMIELQEVRRRTPVHTGALVRSEKTQGPLFTGNRIRVNILVGGSEAPYAVFVHEDLTAHHEHGQAKFLESVLLESRSFMASRVATRLSKLGLFDAAHAVIIGEWTK